LKEKSWKVRRERRRGEGIIWHVRWRRPKAALDMVLFWPSLFSKSSPLRCDMELELELELELGLELFGDGEGLMLECEMILWLRKSVGELKMVRF